MAVLIGLLSISPPTCQIKAAIYGGPNELGQYQVRLTYPPDCRATLLKARLITKNGGIIPPIGEFRVAAGYPRQIHYWVWPGAHAQQKMSFQWREVPISNLPKGWY